MCSGGAIIAEQAEDRNFGLCEVVDEDWISTMTFKNQTADVFRWLNEWLSRLRMGILASARPWKREDLYDDL
jgi:hypothetical protein